MNNLIDRQAAIDGFYEMASDIDHLCTVDDYILFLESLPDVNPEPPKIGKWVEDVAYYAEDGCPCIITRCDQCGEPNPVSKFCPNCGAKMEKIYDCE